MAKEPYVSSEVYDMTGGILNPPADDGYNILIAAYLPTGPIGKKKLLSQKELVSKYMLGTAVRADDHMSALFAYLILAENPVYLIRACPVSVLEGITSTGQKLLFDKAYNLLTEYYRFKINDIKDVLNYYYLQIGNKVFASGTSSEIPSSEISGASILDISNTKSIDAIVSNLIKTISSAIPTAGIIKSSDDTIISRNKITRFSKNFGKHTEIVKYGIYNSISSSTGPATVREGVDSAVQMDGITYYMRGTGKSVSGLTNPTPISSPDNKATMVQKYYFLKVLAESGCECYGKFTIGIKDATFVVNNLKYAESDEGKIVLYSNTILTPGTLAAASTPVIKVTIDGTTISYYLSNDDSDTENKNIAIKADNLMEFIVKVMDVVIASDNTKFDSSSTESIIIDGNFTALSSQSSGSLGSTIYTVVSDTDEDATYTYYLSNDSNNKNCIQYDFLHIQVGTYFYYTGEIPEGFSIPAGLTTVEMTDEPVNAEVFKSLLFKNLFLTQEIGKYGDHFIMTSDKDVVADSASIEFTKGRVEQNTTDQFAIIQKFPSTSAVFKFNYSRNSDNKNILDLTINYKDGVDSVDWTMSFVPGVTDGYGVDQWYTRVESDYFYVKNLQDEGETGDILESYSSPAFGDKVGVPDYDIQFMKNAIEEVRQYEDGVYYDQVSDAGVADAGFAKTCQTIAKELNAVYYASMPSSTKTADLIAYVGAADFNDYVTRILAAADRESISGFSKVIPGSIKLIRGALRLFRNKAIEFAPMYDLNHGTVGIVNLVQDFTKDEREKLLDYKIETVKGGINTAYYINDNVTAQPSKSYMSEEQNVRMTNTAIHTLEEFSQQFKAELNTSVTRQKAQDGANDALQRRLFNGKQYTPAMYRAVCDDNNNTLAVIENNQMIIDLYASYTPSIKWVLLRHYIVPLSQVTGE